MKRIIIAAILTSIWLSFACKKQESNSELNKSSSDSTVTQNQPTPAKAESLTNAKVEKAIAELLKDWRMGGSVRVKGIREIPEQNAAVADLQFQQFEYGVTNEDQLIRAKDFKMPAKSGKLIPPPEEMFPPRKISYSKEGKATLTRYNDGRWVLNSVHWGFDTGVKGSVEIH